MSGEHSQFTVHYEQFIIINYVSKDQLPHTVDAHYTTPTTHVNWGPILLKLIGGDIVYSLIWSRTYPRPQRMLLTLNQIVPPDTQYMNNNKINMAGCQSSQ